MVICIAEDRATEEPALMLLLLSLRKHCPGRNVVLFTPNASSGFRDWVAANHPQVTVRSERILQGAGWNIKPHALLKLLSEGHDDVWWFDSDIIVTKDIFSLLGELGPDEFVVTEEALYGHYKDEGYRARAWGFTPHRTFAFALNSCVLRVTGRHSELLNAWVALLADERYLAAQHIRSEVRPFHLFGDQDVLTALLSSSYSNVPCRVLRRGQDILQCFGPCGFTVGERLRSLAFGLPPLIHCQRDKPWQKPADTPPLSRTRDYIDYANLELSPYTYAARPYASEVPEVRAWEQKNSALARVMDRYSLKNAALSGIPIALLYSLSRALKFVIGKRDQFSPRDAYARLKG